MTPETLEKVISDPDFTIGLLTALKDEQQKRRTVELENKALAEEKLQWADRNFINALIRKYAANACGGSFFSAWVIYKNELLYKHGIALNQRLVNYMNKHGIKSKPKTLDMLKDDELPKAVAAAVALCCSANIDISKYLPKNTEARKYNDLAVYMNEAEPAS